MLSHRHPSQRVSPALSEPAVRGVIDAIGGPIGRHGLVGRARWWTPLRVLILLALIFLSLAYAQKAACLGGVVGSDGTVGLNWAGNRQYTAACYSDLIPLYDGRGMSRNAFPYAYSWRDNGQTRYMEYPVLAGLFQGLMGLIANATYPLARAVVAVLPASSWYFTVTAAVMGVLWLVVVRLVAELTGNRVWDTVLVAASPLFIVHAFTNWDIPAVAFAVGAMAAVAHRRPGLAGVLIGLGTAFKLWPLFLLGAYLVLAARSRHWQPWLRMLATAVASWVIVNLPIIVAYPRAWAEFTRLNSERGWEWTTIWAVLSRRLGWAGFDAPGAVPEILNAVTFSLFAAACLAIAVLGMRARRRPRVAELVALIIIAFLLVNKVWSPQYSLWLLVPAVLALPHWRLIIWWGVADMCLWPILMWHMMGADNHGAPGWLLDVAIAGRDGCIVAIGVLILAQMVGRRRDPVRDAHHGLDPLAGPFGQRDGWVWRRRERYP
ncbi:glycosyltransferase family 87 protein [Corynebacterium uterequi]|uniref:Putative integral membrane protein n=1 Tax=Corynebacterium uterequi TaxID=1072256 RepID=A0A0G3HFS6_9CORY|nr:glycosyltransferase 87 family protein [Corynebacterium uterequi]AKK12134.1 putative integral membrane protein [Corynebacterium uterequi]